MKRLIAIMALALLLAAPRVQAQGDSAAGTAAADYLLLPMTARSAALGTTLTGGLSDLNGVEAIQSNPAALMTNAGTNALFSRTSYVADVGINYFGVAQRLGNNNIALTVTAWDFGDIPLTTAEQPDPQGLTYGASTIVLTGTYARQFTDRIAAGLTTKVISESIDDVNASTVAFDAGMTYVVGESGLRFGVSLRNFGPKLTYGGNGLTRSLTVQSTDNTGFPVSFDAESFELPSLLNFGAAYTRQVAEDLNFTVIGNFRSNSYNQDEYSGGLEVDFQRLVFLRGGFQIQEDMDATFYQGWNVGGGVNLNVSDVNFSVDYAYRGTDFFSSVNLISASITL
ncbi:MAG: PorV/PorQ family protein [Bacteroidota bacterium]